MNLIDFKDYPDTTTPINADNLNIMQNNIKNAIEDVKINYSTDEKIVGTWINGKPIYQKTFTFTPEGGNSYNYTHGISNIDQVIDSEVMFQRQNGQFMPLSLIYPVGTYETSVSWSSGYQVTKTQIVLWLGSSAYAQMDTSKYGVAATIRYTKTTD